MKNFNFMRLLRYTLAQLKLEYKGMLKSIAIFAAISIILYTVTAILTSGNDKTEYFNYIPYLLITIYSFMWMYQLCTAFKDYHSSLSSPRVMMLPASKLEKFLSIVINKGFILSVGYGTTLALLICAASLFYSGNLISDTLSAISASFNPNLNISDIQIGANITTTTQIKFFPSVLSFINAISFPLLVGILFRRMQFAIAIAIAVALGLISLIFLILYTKYTQDIRLIESVAEMAQNRGYYEVFFSVIFFIGAWLKFRSLQIKR